MSGLCGTVRATAIAARTKAQGDLTKAALPVDFEGIVIGALADMVTIALVDDRCNVIATAVNFDTVTRVLEAILSASIAAGTFAEARVAQ